MLEYLIFTNAALTDSAVLLLRLAIGPCFVVHALGKLGVVGPGNMAGFEGWLRSLGLPAPALQARLAMSAELMGGILVTLGFFYRPALVVLFFTMMMAVFIGHKGGGYLITNTPPGNEYALNLAVVCVVMALLGPGYYSLDRVLFGLIVITQ
jgi:putative oxidoreductase